MNSSPSRWIKNYIQLVFCLFTKDLDTMDYSPLLFQKLNKYGIIGTANLWLSSYLKEKSQYVCYSSEKSDQINICCGVPITITIFFIIVTCVTMILLHQA